MYRKKLSRIKLSVFRASGFSTVFIVILWLRHSYYNFFIYMFREIGVETLQKISLDIYSTTQAKAKLRFKVFFGTMHTYRNYMQSLVERNDLTALCHLCHTSMSAFLS